MHNSDAASGIDPGIQPPPDWEDQVARFAIVKLDDAGLVCGWNRGAEALKGYAADEVIGTHFSRFYRESDRARGLPARLLEIARTDGSVEDTGWRVRRDGSEFWARVTVTALRDAHGELIGYVNIARDLTDEKVAADEKAALQRTFAHDLLSPVTALRGYLELLEDDIGEDNRMLSLAIGVSDHLAAMATALMAEAASGDNGPLRMLDTDLVVRSGAALVLRQDADSRIDFVRMDRLSVRGDALALRRAFANVIENAAKYSDGPIEVSVEDLGAWVVVTVTDHGRGIDPADLERIVQEGERGRLADPQDGGHGIGLASVERIVHEHSGTFTLTSTLGVGTTATITLPVAAG